mgnify:CR=1 FL=1
MEFCTLKSFDVSTKGADDDVYHDIWSAFKSEGAVRIEALLNETEAAALLAHINATLADEIALASHSDREELQNSLLSIVANLPCPATHSMQEVVEYVLDTWDGVTPGLDQAMECLMAKMYEPDLDQRIDAHRQSLSESSNLLSRGVHDPNRFGNVHSKQNRWDFRLRLDEVVAPIVAKLMRKLSPILAGTHAGTSAHLCELSSLVSDPGNSRQPLHSDTQIDLNEDADINHIVTCFFALQPIDASMGPTVIMPKTHNAAAHRAIKGGANGDKPVPSTANFKPNVQSNLKESNGDAAARATALAVCNVGDAVIMDSRALHCGGANKSNRRRVLFYMSFHSGNADRKPAFGSTLSILPEYEGKFTLNTGVASVSEPMSWRDNKRSEVAKSHHSKGNLKIEKY